MNKNRKKAEGKNTVYQIKIQGHLEQKWEAWINGRTIKTNNEELTNPITSIITNVPDQAALRGIMTKLWDLNLTVISVSMLE